MSKNAVVSLLFLLGIALFGPLLPNVSAQGGNSTNSQPNWAGFNSVELLSKNSPATLYYSSYGNPKSEMMEVLITAYSSTPDQTDDTPYLTASGSYVRTGVVAANFLPFGTKIRMPEIFGSQVFVVEDRLSKEYNDRIDVWFNSKKEAIHFGQKIGKVEILQLQ